jgi:hypothetical protein
MGIETELIVRYFGKVQPLAMQAMRTLPHASATLSRAIAYKRVPASQHLSDSQLIDELFAKQAGQQSGKPHTEK